MSDKLYEASARLPPVRLAASGAVVARGSVACINVCAGSRGGFINSVGPVSTPACTSQSKDSLFCTLLFAKSYMLISCSLSACLHVSLALCKLCAGSSPLSSLMWPTSIISSCSSCTTTFTGLGWLYSVHLVGTSIDPSLSSYSSVESTTSSINTFFGIISILLIVFAVSGKYLFNW